MLDPDSLRPEYRVLLLGATEPELARRLAVRLTHGLVVILCGRDQLHDGRRELRDLDNVMLIPLDGDSIPWRDGFFDTVVELRSDWAEPAAMQREIRRVTNPNPGD